MLRLDRGEDALVPVDVARQDPNKNESRRTRHQNLLTELEVAPGNLKKKRAAEAARVVPQSR